jgi:hypothetical protein
MYFIDKAAEALWHHAKEHHHNHKCLGRFTYAHHAAHCGMGKSRKVDETSRKYFVIAVNIKQPQLYSLFRIRHFIFASRFLQDVHCFLT